MRFIIAMLFTIGGLVTSCTKEDQSAIDSQVVGNWTWQSQSIGSPTNTSTPQSTGITEILTLNNDGSWSKLQNGTTVNNGSFKTSIETSSRGTKVNAIHYRTANTDSTTYYTITGNLLTFSNDLIGSAGGGVRIYSRQ